MKPAKRLTLGAWLLVVWLALWGSVTTANVAGGLVVAATVQLLPDPHPVGGRFSMRPLAALRFVGYFAYKLVEASVVVAREAVTRHDRTNTGIVEVPLLGASDSLVTVVANAIALMPGSVTVEVERDPPTLYVHVLHLRSVEYAAHHPCRSQKVSQGASGIHREPIIVLIVFWATDSTPGANDYGMSEKYPR